MKHVHSVHVTGCMFAAGARYSLGYFVWPAMNDIIQGRSGKTPPTTMAALMAKVETPPLCIISQAEGCANYSQIVMSPLYNALMGLDCLGDGIACYGGYGPYAQHR